MSKTNRTKEVKEDSEITKRLDAIIRLQMENLSIKKSSMAKLYMILQDSGLTTKDIGKIINKAPNKVSSDIIHYRSDLKKKSKKKGEKNGK